MSGWQANPFVVKVKAGDVKAFCMCGLSADGPFCDGSHKTTDKKPDVVKFTEDKRLFVCGCQKSGDRPFCDGTLFFELNEKREYYPNKKESDLNKWARPWEHS